MDAAAGGAVLNYRAVLAIDADTILTHLRLGAARSAYQRRLHKLYNPKTPA